MAPLILAAISLASKFAPEVVQYMTGSESAGVIAEKVLDVAKEVTGIPSNEGAIAAIEADPALALQFKTKVMEHESAMEQMYLTDVQSARARDMVFIEKGKTNTRANWMLAVTVAGIVGCVWVMVAHNLSADSAIGGILIFLIGKLVGNWEAAFNFEYGTTRGSRTKDDTIASQARSLIKRGKPD